MFVQSNLWKTQVQYDLASEINCTFAWFTEWRWTDRFDGASRPERAECVGFAEARWQRGVLMMGLCSPLAEYPPEL